MSKHKHKGKHKGKGKVRIVGGRWRGRCLRVLDLPGLRPSTDRSRETLFNWLAPQLGGARCLDLFAGSGALGLEALSRGAASVILVEQNRRAVELLREQVASLAANAFIEQADTLVFLRRNNNGSSNGGGVFDTVFLDPPYGSGLIEECLGLLEEGGWLSCGASVYVELGEEERLPALPAGWEVCRQGRCGGSAMYLLSKID